MDPRDLHAAGCPDQAGRSGSAPSRSGQVPSRRGANLPQLLPVGVFHAVFPSMPILHPEIHLEDGRGWQDEDAHLGPGQSDRGRGVQDGQEEAAPGLHRQQPARTHPVRVHLHRLRGAQLHQRRRADLLHEPVPGRRVHHVRTGSGTVPGDGSGGPSRPDDPSFPTHHQVHLPQLRPFRRRAEVRCPLHSALEHCQREGLRLPLVLVPSAGHRHRSLPRLPDPGHRVAQIPPAPAQDEVPTGPTGFHRDCGEKNSAGRLVRLRFNRQEHGWVNLQGIHCGISQSV